MSNTGGLAFPLVHEIAPEAGHPQGARAIKVYEGMTLRDYFAAKAMQALIANNGFSVPSTDSNAAYAVADAMLKAREQ